MKTKYFVLIIILIAIVSISTICLAEVNSILQIIPSGPAGWVKVNHLGDFISKADIIIRRLAPPEVELRQGIVLTELNRILPFGKIINNVSDLEALGLNTEGEFGIFWIDIKSPKPLYAVRIKSKEKLESALKNRIDLINVKYQDILYKKSERDILVILDDVLVFTQQSEIDIQKCIETYIKINKSLLEDPYYINLDKRWKARICDAIACFSSDGIVKISPQIKAVTDTKQGLGSLLLDQIRATTVLVMLDTVKPCVKMQYLLDFKKDSYTQRFLITDLVGSLEIPPIAELGIKLLVSNAYKSDWSPDGSQIVFGKGGGGICVMALATGNISKLTNFGKDPSWSPDGYFIAFVNEPDQTFENEEIWLVESANGTPRKLADGGFPSWSADGKSVIYISRKENRMYSLDVHEPNANQVLYFKHPPGDYPAISSDGKQIAFGVDGQLIITDKETGKTITTWQTGQPGLLMCWSPDGSKVAYGGYGSYGLWLFDVSKGNAIRVLSGSYTMPTWSRDGTKLALDLRVNPEGSIWMIETRALQNALDELSVIISYIIAD